MRKIFRNIALVLMIGVSGITMDTEARLPKYMAQRAAELLIEKSGIIINFDERNLEELLKHLKHNKSPKLNKYASIVLRVLGQDDSNTSLVNNVLTQKLKDFKDELGYNISKCKKEILNAIYADRLVQFLYTTEKRQHLANWMNRRIHKGEISPDVVVDDKTKPTNEFISLFDNTEGGYRDDKNFRKFVNQYFPCWTGTLTCFMLSEKSKAYSLLIKNSFIQEIKNSMTVDSNGEKLIVILFILELIDNWNDIREICENSEEPIPTIPDINDPYECVPVPNTMYVIKGRKFQGSCMISTILNLISMFSWNYSSKKFVFSTKNLRKGIREYFCNLSNIAEIPGTTTPSKLQEFSKHVFLTIPEKRYEPTIQLFICILNEMLEEEFREKILATSDFLLISDIKTMNAHIQNVLQKITGNRNIKTSLNKLNQKWPQHELKITGEINNNNKIITVGLGQRGNGNHIEITKIENIPQSKQEAINKKDHQS